MKKDKPKKGIIIAFGELFLKSQGVRNIFIKRLVWNLIYFFEKEEIKFKIHLSHERIFAEIASNPKKAKEIIKRTFGISWLAEGFLFSKADFNEVLEFIKNNHRDWIKDKETFAIRLKTDSEIKNKTEIIDKIAELINRKVDLSNPKKQIFIEAKKGNWFVCFKKIKGKGGFPAGSSGKALVLMSGGIDSPVASYFALKKGAENIWLHFHSFPLVSNKSIEKVKETAKIFLDFQPKLKILFVPFQRAQIEIKLKVPAEYRILIYRRLMFRIAEKIAEMEKCQALVTGESLGQVSSQTMPNMKIIEEAVKIPILRPLICNDKEEIIAVSKEIGVYDISIKLQEDCCTLFAPRHSSANGNIKIVKELEKKLDIKKIIKNAIGGVKVEIY